VIVSGAAGGWLAAGVRSDACGLLDLVAPGCEAGGWDRDGLALEAGWAGRWTMAWKTPEGEVVCPVGEAGSVRVADCRPVRPFAWRTSQRHRPGLQFMVSTGRHHGFESIAERYLLLALDFAADVVTVVSQPHRMRFWAAGGVVMEHTPDFLVVTGDGTWLVDVRPAGRIGERDRVKFAASAEAALSCGWRYLVVTGWRAHVVTTLDTLSAQRRALSDPLGVQAGLLGAAEGAGRVSFGELVAGRCCPPVARAHALHLIWHRQLGIDLAAPFGDGSLVWRAGR